MIDERDTQTLELNLHELKARHAPVRDFVGRLKLCAALHERGLRDLTVATPAWEAVVSAISFYHEDSIIGETCYNATNHLRRLNGEDPIEDEWQVICWRVQRHCKELVASGRVRKPGKKRDVAGARRQRAKKAGQLSLCLDGMGVQL